jgi:hypothetical protein
MSIERSSNAYDQQILSKIGKPSSPVIDANHLCQSQDGEMGTGLFYTNNNTINLSSRSNRSYDQVVYSPTRLTLVSKYAENLDSTDSAPRSPVMDLDSMEMRENYWTQSSVPVSPVSSANTLLREVEAFEHQGRLRSLSPDEPSHFLDNIHFDAWGPQPEQRKVKKLSTLPPPPIILGSVLSFECYICKRQVRLERKREWR